jgi:hypothetical protein
MPSPRRVFLVAASYGLAVLLPQYFMEGTMCKKFPPPLAHSEQFYGIIGVVVAWQCAFLLIVGEVRQDNRPNLLRSSARFLKLRAKFVVGIHLKRCGKPKKWVPARKITLLSDFRGFSSVNENTPLGMFN